MQRLNAASCLLLALLMPTALSFAAERTKLTVVQTHSGANLGEAALEDSDSSGITWSRCNGISGVYSREFGYYCPPAGDPLDPASVSNKRGYSFFYDLSVIMPDEARIVLHCSTVLSTDCQSLPDYPEQTSVVCGDFVAAGTRYQDCTASGPSPAGVGVYEVAQQGDDVTIFGSNWHRHYLKYGTWQFLHQAAPQDAKSTSAAVSTDQKPPTGDAPGDDKTTKPTAPETPPSAENAQIVDPRIIEQAKAGDPVAQYKLGYDYYLGRGVPQDYAQTAIWWRKAAEQGYPDAQNNLGVLYNSGKGVPQSYSEAYFWQNLAAARANGPLQVQFAKNRDESASRLSLFERLRVQKRASRWAAEHPIQPRSAEPKPDHP